ncbi:MAG TPA: hypothetical protein DCY13_02385 [Verrucomicrobiales bacterium]|nr:hypothetical protein [Verrucomicrobiales bacterium]
MKQEVLARMEWSPSQASAGLFGWCFHLYLDVFRVPPRLTDPLVQSGRMKMNQSASPQLEFALKGKSLPRRRKRPSQRRQRAFWWFREMHRVVDEAIDRVADPATPRQQWLTASASR